MVSQSQAISSEERDSFWTRPLSSFVVLNWELVLYGLILALALFTRFYDLGARAVSHDESLHALYSYKLYDGDGYRHDPLMHGPLLFHVTALSYFLFGDNNFTFRAGVALFGVILVMLPIGMRPWLGRLGALLASGMLLISPAVMHYSRHLRHDIFNAVFTVLMFMALFQFLRARLAEDEDSTRRAWRWLTVGAAAVALSLTTKEVAFIHGFIGFTFIVGISLFEAVAARRQLSWFGAGLILLVVVGGIVLWLTFGNAGPAPEGDLSLARRVIASLASVGGSPSAEGAADSQAGTGAVWKLIQLVTLVVGLAFAATTLALSAARWPLMAETIRSIPLRRLGIATLVGGVLFVVFYTTFFTNPYGVVSGTWGAVSYWLRQQDVQRGGQPWYYYLLLLPLYEFLPLLVGTGGGVWYLIRRVRDLRGQMVSEGRTAKGQASHRPGAGPVETIVNSPSTVILQRYFAALLIYWVISALFIYSWAGEKMPWLTVHLTLPFIFLAAWTVDRALGSVDWREAWARGGAVFGLLLPLAGGALLALFSVQPFQGVSLFDLRDTGQWLGSLLVAVLVIYALVRYGRRLGRVLAGRVALAVIIVILALLTLRFAWMVSFINYDYVSEYLFYAHAAPDVTLGMQQIEELSRRTVGDKQIKVAYDNESTWPFEWYFREYPNRAYYADSPNREQLDAPIVIVGSPNESKVKPFLGDRYQRFSYRLVWWPIEDYKDQSPRKIWHTYVRPDLSGAEDETTRAAAWDEVRQNRKELWNILFYRRHATPFNQWPYVHRYYMYVRKDVLNELWDYQTGPVTLPVVVEPYAEGFREVRAVRAFGNAGSGNGQFMTPRAVAIGPEGQLYVADSGNNRIQVLDSEGNFIRAWGSAGSGPGQFQEPWGIAVSQAGRVYVADTWNHRVQVFDLEGNYLFSWGSFADTKGEADGTPGVFWGPRDLALDAQGNLYVADTGNKRIQVFTPEGEYLDQWGGGGLIPGRFEEPTGIAIGPDGSIYVADTWNRRVQKFTPAYEPLAEWPIEGWESESVVNKPYLRVDSASRVYVSDPEGYRVLVFDDQGQFLITFGQYGFDMASFALPLGMAIDAEDNLYVVDSDNSRVLKFSADSLQSELR
ncbi:MAG: TIGR03663 family protein [Anaerolineae bacterium]